MDTSRKRIASNIMFLAGSQALGWILASFYVFIIPRYLGPSTLGILAWVSAIGNILAVIGNFGVATYILREFARSPQRAQEMVGPAVIINVVFGLVGWLCGFIVISQFNQPDIVIVIFLLTGLTGTLYLSINPLRAALQGMDKMQFSFFETIVYKVSSTLLVLAVVALNLGFVMIAIAWLVSTIILIVAYWWWYLKYSNVKLTVTWSVYGTLVKGGMSFLLIDISYNVYINLDSLLLSIMTNSKTVGFYSLPVRILGSMIMAPVLVGQALLPTLSRLAKDDTSKAQDISRNTLSWMVCLSLPMAVGCTVIAEPFIIFFYTQEYAPSIPVLILLAWTAVPMYLGVGLYQILISQDKQGGWSKLMILAVFIDGGLNLLLIPYFQNTFDNGAIGAGVALLVSEIFIDLLGIRLVSREIVNKQLLVNGLKSLGAALVMGIVIWPLRDLWIFVPVLVGMAVYGIIIVFAFNLTGYVKLIYTRLVEWLARSRMTAKTPAATILEPALKLPEPVVEAQTK